MSGNGSKVFGDVGISYDDNQIPQNVHTHATSIETLVGELTTVTSSFTGGSQSIAVDGFSTAISTAIEATNEVVKRLYSVETILLTQMDIVAAIDADAAAKAGGKTNGI